MIKLLYCEKGKKNKTNLFFLSGNRVREYINRTLNREQQLTALLKYHPLFSLEIQDYCSHSVI